MAVNAFVALEPFPGWSIPWQDGRTILITGATSGIGLHASRHLAQAGARLILGCRDMKAAEDVVSGIRSESGNANIEAWELDLSKFDSVRAFAERIEQNGVDLDVVVHNAGISPPQGIRQVTTDGHELVVQTNHLSPFLLTHLLLPSLKRAAKKQGHARIVYVTGLIANAKIELDNLDSQNDWVGSRKYADTKLMNIVVAMELGKRLKSSPDMQGVIAHVLAPGFFRTGLARDAAPEVKAWLEKLRDEQAALVYATARG